MKEEYFNSTDEFEALRWVFCGIEFLLVFSGRTNSGLLNLGETGVETRKQMETG